MKEDFFTDYYLEYEKKLRPKWLFKKLSTSEELFKKSRKSRGKLVFCGNGASAAIASHAALDFSKQAKIKSATYHDPALLTAFSNDYGYENALAKILEFNLNKNDVVVFISVSGESPNIIKAAEFAKSLGISIVTFTGKNEKNSLRELGDINFWVDSHAYNIVEGIHMIWITSIIDSIIGKKVYSVS